MCSFWRENSNTFSCFENACSSLHSQNCSMRLIEWFSNTVNFVFATSIPYSVQCAKTNMSYRNRNTTAFCSRRTTMVTRIFFCCCYCCHILWIAFSECSLMLWQPFCQNIGTLPERFSSFSIWFVPKNGALFN